MANGYVLFEDQLRVVIATMRSSNRKTGDMVQTWILYRHELPLDSLKSGKDKAVCGKCIHRPNVRGKRSCYVDVGRAPQGVWKAYRRGRYPKLTIGEYSATFAGRAVRFGAYGDPASVPTEIWSELQRVAKNHTAYTHNWKRGDSLRSVAMASVDSEEEYMAARANGWRTFRVSKDTTVLPGEIMCPASEEAGHRTQCIKCKLCDGVRVNDKRKSIVIQAHGTGKNNFVQLSLPRVPQSLLR